MSVEIKRELTEAEERVAEAIRNAKPLPPEAPRVNAYVCKKCGHVTNTVDVAHGTTTMVLPCMAHTDSRIVSITGDKIRTCDGEMLSSFYTVDSSNMDMREIPFEWRFATLPEYREYRKKHIALADHVADGGLVLHKRSNKDAPVLTHGGFFVRPNGDRLSDAEAASLQTGLQVLKEVVRLDIDKAKRKRHEREMALHKKRSERKKKRKK